MIFMWILGSFDGLHLGHMKLIDGNKACKENNGKKHGIYL